MNYNLNYLLKYISMESLNHLLNTTNKYFQEELHDNQRNVLLNTEYLIKYGVIINEKMFINYLDELMKEPDAFTKKITNYEKTLTKEEIISLIENN